MHQEHRFGYILWRLRVIDHVGWQPQQLAILYKHGEWTPKAAGEVLSQGRADHAEGVGTLLLTQMHLPHPAAHIAPEPFRDDDARVLLTNLTPPFNGADSHVHLAAQRLLDKVLPRLGLLREPGQREVPAPQVPEDLVADFLGNTHTTLFLYLSSIKPFAILSDVLRTTHCVSGHKLSKGSSMSPFDFFLVLRGKTRRELAQAMGISEPSLYRKLHGELPLTDQNIEDAATLLRVTPGHLRMAPNILEILLLDALGLTESTVAR